jgi:uncharacterized protein (TIGR00725 family)
MTALVRLPIVGVLGSGVQAHLDRARPLGAWLAGLGVHLLTGGGGGVMRAVAEAFCGAANRRGLSLGVLPAADDDPLCSPRQGYPNPFVEIPVRTHLPLVGHRGQESLSRNHINVLTPVVLVALPGGPGTASEVALAVRYQRPIVAWLGDRSEIPGLPQAVQVADEFASVQRFVVERLAFSAGSG